MSVRLFLRPFITFVCFALICNSLRAELRAEKIITGLKMPVFLTAPVGSQDFLYILEKQGKIRLYDRRSKKLLEKPFLDISTQIKIKMNEQGLLGMAFSPRYASDHCFYLYYTDLKGDTQISRFRVSPDGIEEEKIIHFKQLARNHNGGWMGFGPDGMLYIGTGDGGKSNDPNNNAQNPQSLLGKILCIDVSPHFSYKTIPRNNKLHPALPANTKPEIFALGLRNPWRCSWDGNDLYIADVGQYAYEEINVISHDRLRGANFGWREREGQHKNKRYAKKKPTQAKAIDPVFNYQRNEGFSITGGYVYRGKIQSLQGHYFFADFIIPHIWSFIHTPKAEHPIKHLTDWSDFLTDNGKRIKRIASFGKDPQGELYIISHGGHVYKIME